MTKLLHIDSSPLAGQSVSRELTRRIVAQWQDSHPGTTVEYLDLAADVVVALQVPGDDHGIPGNVRREHRHPLRGVGKAAGHKVRPISASICALARR